MQPSAINTQYRNNETWKGDILSHPFKIHPSSHEVNLLRSYMIIKTLPPTTVVATANVRMPAATLSLVATGSIFKSIASV
jgi:hypothetical protein